MKDVLDKSNNLLKPILLLDVDGVLSAMPMFEDDISQYMEAFIEGSYIYYRPEIVEWLKDLEKYADIYWCTGWEESAHSISEVLDLPKYPLVDTSKCNITPNRCWKAKALEAFVEENKDRAFIWADDEIDSEDYVWAEQIDNPHLLIKCDPVRGISQEEMDEITIWARKINQ